MRTRRSEENIISERALREIYLKGFEIAIKESGTDAVMTTYGPVNGIWTSSRHDLNTCILRNEWAFDGLVMTDNANTGVFMDGYQMTEAGADVKLTTLPSAARYNFDKNDAATYYYARQAMHHMLYIIANSKAMNGAMPGSHIKDGARITTHVMRIVTVVFVLLILLEIYKIFRLFKPTAKKLAKLQAKAEKRAAKKAK